MDNKWLLLTAGIFLSACTSTKFSSKDVTTYVTDQYSGNPEISLGANFQRSVQRLRDATVHKLKNFSQGQSVRLYVSGYRNGINSNFDSLPLGGANHNLAPTHAAFTVFKGTGFKVIPGKCPRNSVPNDFEVITSVVAYDEDTFFKRSGWELSGDSGSGSGTYDTSNWLSNSKLVLLTQLKNCSNNQIRSSNYLPLTLVSMNEANSFLLFNKLLGVYRSDSLSVRASAQLDRDKASVLGMMKIASEFSGLTAAEFEFAIYGFTSSYNEKLGVVETLYDADSEFDPNLGHFIFSVEYFGDDKVETTLLPFGKRVQLKLRHTNKSPSRTSGVRKLSVNIKYRNEVVYKKSII
jgi:hypothetical protein